MTMLIKELFIFIVFILLTTTSLQAQNEKMTLESGRTYYIYACPDASKVVVHATEELSKYITQIFNVPCVQQSASLGRPEMLVLTKEKNDTKYVLPATTILGEDGYYLNIQKDAIVIGGQNGRGVLYGVYSFYKKTII